MKYTILSDDTIVAWLDLSERPSWKTAESRYPISRLLSELPNWGPEASYVVSGPDGVEAEGSCSNHEGCGVWVPGGEWGFSRVDDSVMQLGEQTRLTIDREGREVQVETAEPPDMLPYIICGLCILLDGS